MDDCNAMVLDAEKIIDKSQQQFTQRLAHVENYYKELIERRDSEVQALQAEVKQLKGVQTIGPTHKQNQTQNFNTIMACSGNIPPVFEDQTTFSLPETLPDSRME
jgi:hypothetical protein